MPLPGPARALCRARLATLPGRSAQISRSRSEAGPFCARRARRGENRPGKSTLGGPGAATFDPAGARRCPCRARNRPRPGPPHLRPGPQLYPAASAHKKIKNRDLPFIYLFPTCVQWGPMQCLRRRPSAGRRLFSTANLPTPGTLPTSSAASASLPSVDASVLTDADISRFNQESGTAALSHWRDRLRCPRRCY